MPDLHSLFSIERPAEQPVFHDGISLRRWGQFAGQVASLVEQLQRRAERRWLLESNDPGEFLVQLFAALFAGKQAVVLPNLQAGTLERLSSQVDARFLGMEYEVKAGCPLLPAVDPHTATIILFTSGSTGQPKQICKTLAELELEVKMIESIWGAEVGTSSVIGTVPHQHAYGLVYRFFWSLSAGRFFDVVTCSHPGLLEERLNVVGPSTLITTPAHLSRLPELLSLERLAPKLRAIFSAGSPLSLSVSNEFFSATNIRPIEVFGSTETSGLAWRRQGEADGELWHPFPGLEVTVSAMGALRLRSPYVQNGDPYDMDDGIELLPDGRFSLLGRLDRVVKIEEERLSLPEMELRLDGHPWVRSTAIVPLVTRKQERERQTTGAAIVLNKEGKEQLASQGRSRTILSLRRYLFAHFKAVLLPRYWRFVDDLPVDERGKIATESLKKLFDKASDPEGEPVLLPTIGNICYAKDSDYEVVLSLHIPSELEHFAGHFAGMPILPGVVQVDWAVQFAREYLNLADELDNRFSAVKNLKFLFPVPPDIDLDLYLKWHRPASRLDFMYSTPQRKYSAGRLLFDRGF